MAVDFAAAVKKLPPEAQQRVQAWMGTQMFVARELGLSSQAWLTYVEWAFAHPLDFSFVGQGADTTALEDAMSLAPADKAARKVIGAAEAPVQAAAKADPNTSRKAGLSNMHTLGDMLPRDKKR